MFFSALKNKYPEDDEINRTKESNKKFDSENGKELKQLYLTSDLILFADVFDEFVKVSTTQIGINLLSCVRLPVYTYQCSLECKILYYKHFNIKI